MVEKFGNTKSFLFFFKLYPCLACGSAFCQLADKRVSCFKSSRRDGVKVGCVIGLREMNIRWFPKALSISCLFQEASLL